MDGAALQKNRRSTNERARRANPYYRRLADARREANAILQRYLAARIRKHDPRSAPLPARAGARRALALERPIDSLESPPDRRAALFVGQDVELLLVDGAHDHRCDVVHVEHASGEIGVGLVLIQHLR
jgi:hypothetical protein